MLSPFLRWFPLLPPDMKFLLGLLSHRVLELILPLGPYTSLTHRLLPHYIVHLKRTLHFFGPKEILFAYCSSLRDSPHGPSSFQVCAGCQNDMRIIPLSIWLFFVMGDHVLSRFLEWHDPY